MRKKIKVMISIFLSIILLTSCDFFEYVPNEMENENIIELKEQYKEELNKLRSLDEFREEEQRVYRIALQEGINQLNECKEKEELEITYTKNKEIILTIKTAKEYEEEEEEIKRRKKSEEEKYITELQNITKEENYLEEEKELYKYYLELGIKALQENEDLEMFELIFEAYKERIEGLKSKEAYIKEWQINYIKEIEEYIDFSQYREEEQEKIREISNIAKESITVSNLKEEMENILRDYKVKIYEIPTDKELYEVELKDLKKNAIEEIKTYKDITEYRENEQTILQTLWASFEKLVVIYEEKEIVVELLKAYKDNMDSLKTEAQYYEEERLDLINEYFNDLLAQSNIIEVTEEAKLQFIEKCYKIKEEMLAMPLKEDITAKYLMENEQLYTYLAQLGDPKSLKKLKEILISQLKNHLNEDEYRNSQIQEIRSILISQENKILLLQTYDEILEEVELSEQLLDEIKTNDELWEEEDNAFIECLTEKYKTIINVPKSISIADDYYELAQIIDFYAFYQIDGFSFERDTFRVKINFEEDKDATWIKNEVYWYSELLRSAVGIDTKFEKNRQLLITLIPYNFATVSNKSTDSIVSRNESLSYYDNVTSINREKRNIDFDDFKYYQYEKEILVWNTQQLWYALEHEYIPICKEGSIAEAVMNKAKEILRTIITNDMTEEEKIFEIFSWFGRNVEYDFQIGPYNDSSDMYKYPDEMISSLNCFFAEGALLDNLAVCSGYAKAYLILLRIEGIESLRILARCHQLQGKNSINGRDDGTGGYGSHEFVYVKIGDEWYFSDVEKSSCEARQELISYVYILLPPSYETYGYTVMFPELKLGNEILSIYKRIKYKENSILVSDYASLNKFMSDLESTNKYQTSICLSYYEYPNGVNDIIDLIPTGFDIYVLKVGYKITEIIIYN